VLFEEIIVVYFENHTRFINTKHTVKDLLLKQVVLVVPSGLLRAKFMG
jgi:hypothetical protein